MTDFLEKIPKDLRNQMQALGIDYDHFDQFKMKLRSLTSDGLYHTGKVKATGRMFQVDHGEAQPVEPEREDERASEPDG